MITIFTDGSSKGNPGPGGFAAIISDGLMVREVGGSEKHTTNNRMELKAAIRALESLEPTNDTIYIHTDSQYVMKGITEWIHGWLAKGWKTAQKKPVENQDLWQVLYKNTEGKNIEWKHVAGHAGVAANERCDEIAQGFADGVDVDLYDGPLAQYRVSLEA
ncbi:ribonuclease HI [Candidatus Parcubacteria bacterium]|nr:ribonuclease HI [Candidatus Parcubacteria bacterium]